MEPKIPSNTQHNGSDARAEVIREVPPVQDQPKIQRNTDAERHAEIAQQ